MTKTIYYLVLISVGITCSVLSGCSKINQPENDVSEVIKNKASFPIGAAVTMSHLKETDFSEAFRNNYNQLSAEYEMKMKQIWTSPDGYAFTNPDYLVNYAEQNNMRVHGHVLLWYQSFPDWFNNMGYDSANFENKIKTYIFTVVGRYKGKIVSWDVANEIFADNGSLRVETFVYKTFKDPVAFYGRCFRYARISDPDVKLFYNDYDIVLNAAKRNSVKEMVARFRKEGYPIDGIGEQAHTTIWTNKLSISIGLTDIASTGLLIHISELDLRVNQYKSDSYVFTDSEQQKQSDLVKAIVEMYETLPQVQKFAITTWGVADKYTWLTSWWHPKEYPLLLDSNYAKKKAYYGFFDGLK
jgi:endo-1,4-beta-xylanase